MLRFRSFTRGSAVWVKAVSNNNQTTLSRCCVSDFMTSSQQRNRSSAVDSLVPPHNVFADRHIGPNEDEVQSMLDFVGVKVTCELFLSCMRKILR